MKFKKVTVFAGHYGSGKTNLAVNFALDLKSHGYSSTLCDLDIVNPYFRSKDSEKMLKKHGIPVISSVFANTNLDIPAFPAEAYAMFQKGDMYYVADLGGDDRGAYALGRFSEFMTNPDSYDMILVINKYRPDTATPEAVLEIKSEIEDACHVKFTGIANNSNIGHMTDIEKIKSTVHYAEKVSELTGLPLLMTSYRFDIDGASLPNPYPIRIMTKDIWEIG